jgi:hypothetical protein
MTPELADYIKDPEFVSNGEIELERISVSGGFVNSL